MRAYQFIGVQATPMSAEHGRKAGVVTWLALLATLFSFLGLAFDASAAPAPANTLEAVEFSSLPGDRVQITLTTSGPAPQPLTFAIDNPARVALDFPGTKNKVAQRTQNIGIGMAKGLRIAEARDRTRVVLDLVRIVPYETRVEGNKVFIVLKDSATAAADSPTPTMGATHTAAMAGVPVDATAQGIRNVDFRRGPQGEGQIIVNLTSPSIPVDVRQERGNLVVELHNAQLPANLERRLDVTDFATPVKMVDTFAQGKNVHMVIIPMGEYEHLAYQSDDVLTIEVKQPEKKETEIAKDETFSGERLSLNFQNIEVRSVLQLIADFTGLNIVVSDAVSGSLTLRLQNVPWDQALAIILKTKGLDMRQTGNVVLVAPSEEIATRERQEMESKRQVEELAPLHSEFVQINYAKAADIAALLKAKENTLLSPRGNVTVDERTNTLLLQDTADKLEDIRRLVARLDIPVRQVLIESRIVIANNDFSRDMGVRFGATAMRKNGDDGIITTSGGLAGTDTTVESALDNRRSTGQPLPFEFPSLGDRLNVNLPVAGNAGRIAFAILGSDYLLDLELSALQAEGRGEVVSSPRVITANQREARIEQGVEIPYQEATSSGATSTSFKKAVLSLSVTPQITPDDRIIMDLAVTKDSVGGIYGGIPSINTREVATQVLVDNGETVVLGGIYEQTRVNSVEKVPFLGDLPGLGVLFRSKTETNDKSELLVFVTPKIVKESLGLR